MSSQTQIAGIIVEQGKLLDFIDGTTQRRETPEEYVRQEIAKSIVREYLYQKSTIEVEFVLRVGSRKPRADLVIFAPDVPHVQENAQLIVECKASSIKAADKKDGVGQLQSYMAVCPNVRYGMWTNGVALLLSPPFEGWRHHDRRGSRHPRIWEGRRDCRTSSLRSTQTRHVGRPSFRLPTLP